MPCYVAASPPGSKGSVQLDETELPGGLTSQSVSGYLSLIRGHSLSGGGELDGQQMFFYAQSSLAEVAT